MKFIVCAILDFVCVFGLGSSNFELVPLVIDD